MQPLAVVLCAGFGGSILLARGRRRRCRGGEERPAGAAQAAVDHRTHAMPVAALDSASPERFYLPDPAMADLSDCFAEMDGARLPLHSQLLSVQCSVLRELFVAQRTGDLAGSQAGSPVDLSALFEGSCAEDAACLLRLIYRPQEVHGASFAELAGSDRLDGVARLAHKLDAGAVLCGLESYVQGLTRWPAAEQASVPQLLGALRAAHCCVMPAAVQSACLGVVAERLAAEGEHWPEGRQALLEVMDAATLVHLVRRMAGKAVGGLQLRSRVLDVRDSSSGNSSGGGGTGRSSVHNDALGAAAALAGSSGGGGAENTPAARRGSFIFAIHRFSRQGHSRPLGLLSPWVHLCGLKWRLNVYPKGNLTGTDTHLSVYMYFDPDHARKAGLAKATVKLRITLVDQMQCGRDAGIDLTAAFEREHANWGSSRALPLQQLRAGAPHFLLHDRLLVRAEVEVLGTEAWRAPAGAGQG